jgi:membrane protease YdiL (CAAX protease family)
LDERRKTLREILVFLALTAIFSTLAYIPIVQTGTIEGAQSKLAGLLMLAPGLAAIITYLFFERSLRPIGWRLGKIQYLILSILIPIIYCLIGYGLVWLTKWGQYNGQLSSVPIPLIATLIITGTFGALLEEIAWRGFLVPKMIIITSFTKTALISGLIWAVWHYPLIIFSNVRIGNTPQLYGIICFTILAIGVSFATAWLRLKSGSVWTAALLHGSHNVFMLHVFNTLTTDTGSTWLLLGEYGAVTAVMGIFLIIIFWILRTRLSENK